MHNLLVLMDHVFLRVMHVMDLMNTEMLVGVLTVLMDQMRVRIVLTGY